MKNLKKLFCVIVSFILMMCSALPTYASSTPLGTYDSQIVNTANQYADLTEYSNTDLNPFISANGGRYFTVEEPEKDHFEVDVNEVQMTVLISDKDNIEPYQPQNIKPLSSDKIADIIESSIKKVNDYIDTSSVLADKDNIKNYISTLSIKTADFTDDPDVGAYFSAKDSTIYINNENSDCICEWMVCHELIHSIAFYTHNVDNLADIPYAYSMFNEIMADLITYSINPDINESIESYYKGYYNLLYPYINIFGVDSINAYFYGYDTLYSKVGKPEFDFFVVVVENISEENSEAYYNNLILKWYAKNLC